MVNQISTSFSTPSKNCTLSFIESSPDAIVWFVHLLVLVDKMLDVAGYLAGFLRSCALRVGSTGTVCSGRANGRRTSDRLDPLCGAKRVWSASRIRERARVRAARVRVESERRVAHDARSPQQPGLKENPTKGGRRQITVRECYNPFYIERNKKSELHKFLCFTLPDLKITKGECNYSYRYVNYSNM